MERDVLSSVRVTLKGLSHAITSMAPVHARVGGKEGCVR